jgi:hypothetical protein
MFINVYNLFIYLNYATGQIFLFFKKNIYEEFFNAF